MNKIKLNILNKGNNIYYSDTDSIVTNKPLNSDLTGKEIGKFKLEYVIKKAYFVNSKTYAINTINDEIVIKAKGVNSKELSLNDIKNLYLGENIVTTRFESKLDYNLGTVNINKIKNLTLKGNAYIKREKLY